MCKIIYAKFSAGKSGLATKFKSSEEESDSEDESSPVRSKFEKFFTTEKLALLKLQFRSDHSTNESLSKAIGTNCCWYQKPSSYS